MFEKALFLVIQIMLKIISLCFFLLSAPCLFTQSTPGINYTIHNGLPSNEVYDIFQDSKGFIWLSTDRGACRYDGYSFTIYSTANGLTDNTVFSVQEDSQGRIWFLLSNGTLCYYVDGVISPFKYNNILRERLRGITYVRSFHVGKDGEFTIGFIDQGIIQFDSAGVISAEENSKQISFLAKCDNENIVYGTKKVINPPGNNEYSLKINFRDSLFLLNVTSRYSYNNITAIRLASGGMAVAVMDHVFYIYPDGRIIRQQFDKIISNLFEDVEGKLWIGFLSGGIKITGIRNSNFVQEDTLLSRFSVSNVLIDNEDGLWVSTLEKGVFYFPHRYIHNVTFPENDKFECTSICSGGEGQLFFGTSDGRIFKVSNNTVSLMLNSSRSGFKEKIHSLFYDKLYENLWIGAVTGSLILSDNGTLQKFAITYPRKCILSSSGKIYYGSSMNLYCIENQKILSVINRCKRGHLRVDAVYEDNKNDLWVGSLEGLFKLKDSCLSNMADENSILNCRINCITGTKKGLLALGTIGRGVIFKYGNNFHAVTTEQGLLNNSLNSLASDESDGIWAGSNSGLSRIETGSGKWQIRNFHVGSDLQSNKVNAVLYQDGKIWIATDDGLSYLSVEKISENKKGPVIYINNVKVNNQEVSSTVKHEFQPDQDHLEISFTGISFRSNANLLYKYRITGLEDAWQFTRSRQLIFPKVPSGKYEFEVYAQNEDGLWSDYPARLDFTILPPVWQTWWFISLEIVAGFSVLAGIFYFRIRRIKEKNEIANKIFELKQKSLYTQMNPHFIFNTLTSIQSRILVDDRETAVKYISLFSRLMRAMLESSEKKMISLEEEIELLEKYLNIYTIRFSNRLSFEIILKDVEKEMIFIPSMVIQPIVENAIRHGIMHKAGNGHIKIEFYWQNKNLYCKVDDNGIGRVMAAQLRANDKQPVSHGLRITKERLKLMCEENGIDYEWKETDKTDAEGNASGTIVEFLLPFENAV